MPKKRSPGDGGLFFIPSKKLWRGVVDDGFHPDGRRRQRVVTSRTQAGARAKLDALRAEMRDGRVLDRRTTVREWSETWLEDHCKPKLKPNGFAAYRSVTRTWIVPKIGPKRVADLKPSDVLAVQKSVLAARKSSTARKVYNVLSLMLEAARREGLCARNVAADVVPPVSDDKERQPLTGAQAVTVLRNAYDAGDTRWLVAIIGGIRQSERLGTLIENFDHAASTLTVEWALDEVRSDHGCGEQVDGAWPCGKTRGGSCSSRVYTVPKGMRHRHLTGRLFLLPPKNGKSRTIPLPPVVSDAIQAHIDRLDDQPNPHGLLWPSPTGAPRLPRDDEADWKQLLLRAGVITAEQVAPGSDAPTTHVARHTTATGMLELGIDVKTIGVIVGHQSEAITRRYQHVNDLLARSATDQLATAYADAFAPLELEAALAVGSNGQADRASHQ